MKSKLRPLGQINLDLEVLLKEMTDADKHDMQWGEVLAQVHSWLMVHAPHQREEYEDDGSHPEFYYGPKK